MLLYRLLNLKVPTLIIWGESDHVFPVSQAREAVTHLREGSLELIQDCGHLPHVERVPTTSSPPSTGFLANTAERWQPRESQACLPSADRSA